MSSFGLSRTNAHLILEKYQDSRFPESEIAWPASPIKWNRKRFWIGESGKSDQDRENRANSEQEKASKDDAEIEDFDLF